MSETTMAAVAAALRIKYDDGQVPWANYRDFPFVATVKKPTNMIGQSYDFAFGTEGPQGSGHDYPTALSNIQTSRLNKFSATPVNHYGIFQIRGDVIKRATGAGAMIDVVDAETTGASLTELKQHEIHSFRGGAGVLGTTASGTATATVQLTEPADVVNFDLGMTVRAVSNTTLTPTVRAEASKATITGINRLTGTLTFGAALNTLATSAVDGDSLVRSSDQAGFDSAGVPSVITGLDLWVDGAGAPLFGNSTRTSDVVRNAGQAYDSTGVPYEDALIEAEAQLDIQGYADGALVVWANPLDVKEMKKSLGGKSVYPRSEMKGSGSMASISFRGIELEGSKATIKLMTSPFVPRHRAYFVDMGVLQLASAGGAPFLWDWDKATMLRTGTDDNYRGYFASYAQFICKQPWKCLRLLNWGL